MNILSLSCDSLLREFQKKYGKGPYYSNAVYRHVMQRGGKNIQDIIEFKGIKALAAKIQNDLEIQIPEITKLIKEGETKKIVIKLHDGFESESVIIPMKNYKTLCVSSQVGCRMKCRFCATGAMGFKRNLSVAEITGQVYAARFILGEKIKNLVLMGMGEPFDNFENVTSAIEVLTEQRGMNFAQRHITVSTVGLPGKINRFAELNLKKINLAVSLNAPDDELRSMLMPANKKYSMAELKKDLLNYPLRNKGYFFIEYVLIKGINDSAEDAKKVAEYLSGLKVRVNLIPLNKTSNFQSEQTLDEDVHRFAGYLESYNVFVRKRWRKGSGIIVGCGQLGKE